MLQVASVGVCGVLLYAVHRFGGAGGGISLFVARCVPIVDDPGGVTLS